jgi:hypothetical protein
MNNDKIILIEEIKHLISVDGSNTDINSKYLEYFEIDELENIKIELLSKKEKKKEFTKKYVDELYDKFTK